MGSALLSAIGCTGPPAASSACERTGGYVRVVGVSRVPLDEFQRTGTAIATSINMPEKTTTALETPLREQLDRLAAYQATELPVLSLYLDMRPDQNGRPNYDVFLRKVFADRSRGL